MYSYFGIVNDLLKEFPEISKNYAEEIYGSRIRLKARRTEVRRSILTAVSVTILDTCWWMGARIILR